MVTDRRKVKAADLNQVICILMSMGARFTVAPQNVGDTLVIIDFPAYWTTVDESLERYREVVAMAREQLELRDGELELDDDAEVSEGGDNGAYVQTWRWVSFAGTPLDNESNGSSDDEVPADEKI